jgi:hypothetical protein
MTCTSLDENRSIFGRNFTVQRSDGIEVIMSYTVEELEFCRWNALEALKDTKV